MSGRTAVRRDAAFAFAHPAAPHSPGITGVILVISYRRATGRKCHEVVPGPHVLVSPLRGALVLADHTAEYLPVLDRRVPQHDSQVLATGLPLVAVVAPCMGR